MYLTEFGLIFGLICALFVNYLTKIRCLGGLFLHHYAYLANSHNLTPFQPLPMACRPTKSLFLNKPDLGFTLLH
jgi:hypothetical protein